MFGVAGVLYFLAGLRCGLWGWGRGGSRGRRLLAAGFLGRGAQSRCVNSRASQDHLQRLGNVARSNKCMCVAMSLDATSHSHTLRIASAVQRATSRGLKGSLNWRSFSSNAHATHSSKVSAAALRVSPLLSLVLLHVFFLLFSLAFSTSLSGSLCLSSVKYSSPCLYDVVKQQVSICT